MHGLMLAVHALLLEIMFLLPAHSCHSPLAGHVLLVVVHAVSQIQHTLRKVFINVIAPHICGVSRHYKEQEYCNTETGDRLSWPNSSLLALCDAQVRQLENATKNTHTESLLKWVTHLCYFSCLFCSNCCAPLIHFLVIIRCHKCKKQIFVNVKNLKSCHLKFTLNSCLQAAGCEADAYGLFYAAHTPIFTHRVCNFTIRCVWDFNGNLTQVSNVLRTQSKCTWSRDYN